MQVKIDKFGRVLIPKILRQQLKLEPGMVMVADADEEAISIALKVGRATQRIHYSEQGLPIRVGGGGDANSKSAKEHIQETYDAYFDRKLGLSEGAR